MPSSHLTREVFRRFLANEPIVHQGCLRQRAYATSTESQPCQRRHVIRSHRGVPALVRAPQRRTFFNLNLFPATKADPRPAPAAPGLAMMKHLAKMQNLNSRLPSVPEVAKAFEAFFIYKAAREARGVEDTHVQLALQSFRYCVAARSSAQIDGQGSEETPADIAFRGVAIGVAAKVLRAGMPYHSPAHLELARALWEYNIANATRLTPNPRIFQTYVQMLCESDQVQEAREVITATEAALKTRASRSQPIYNESKPNNPSAVSVVLQNKTQGQASQEQPSRKFDQGTWETVFQYLLKATARVGSEEELLDLRTMIMERGLPLDLAYTRAMLTLNLRMNNLDSAQARIDELLLQCAELDHKDFANLMHEVLQWSLQNGKSDFGHSVVRKAMDEAPRKLVWDEVLVWSAGSGKGADEISRMLKVMVESNAKLPEAQYPDVHTINRLVEFAVSKNDPYLAERFIVIGKEIGEKLIKECGQEHGIQPNAKTCILQMEYRLRVNDVDGALVAYKSLQGMDLSGNADIPTVNKLIIALCESDRHDFETVDNVVQDLVDRQARFDGNTVSSLATLHLNRDEFDHAQDLIGFHSGHFSLAERAKVRSDLIAYIIMPTSSVSRAWDAYGLLREFFDETALEERTQIMLSFLTARRFRPDLAAEIFITMRQHTRRDTNPLADTYVAFFSAAPRHKDWTVHENPASSIAVMNKQLQKNRAAQENAMNSVEVIHNQLKLDPSITPSTRIYNALMIAYLGGDRFQACLNFWNAINASKEGPTYNSIHLVLRACENAPRGDVRAAQIWSRLRSLDIEMDTRLWASYAAALVGNGDNQRGFAAVEKGVEDGELVVDAFLLASMFDSGYGEVKENEIQEWAKEKFPQQWKEVEAMGFYERPNGFRYVKGLNRDIEP